MARMWGRHLFCGAFMLCGASSAVAADQQPICADRPGKATSACTVPVGHWQLETGIADWSLQKAGGERDTSLALGETTVKYGLADASDIEVDITPWERSSSRAADLHQSASGFGDVNLIYKQRLSSSSAPLQVIAMPVVKIPTAKHSLGNGEWEAGLLVPIAYSIPKTPLSIGLTPEIDWAADADDGGHHAAMEQVVSLGCAATSKFSLSAELWRQWDWDPARTTHEASADGALAYLVSNNVQLDAGANLGLNRNTPDVELYAGYSQRF